MLPALILAVVLGTRVGVGLAHLAVRVAGTWLGLANPIDDFITLAVIIALVGVTVACAVRVEIAVIAAVIYYLRLCLWLLTEDSTLFTVIFFL